MLGNWWCNHSCGQRKKKILCGSLRLKESPRISSSGSSLGYKYFILCIIWLFFSFLFISILSGFSRIGNLVFVLYLGLLGVNIKRDRKPWVSTRLLKKKIPKETLLINQTVSLYILQGVNPNSNRLTKVNLFIYFFW